MKRLIITSAVLIAAMVCLASVVPPRAEYTAARAVPSFPCILVDAGHGGVDGGAVAKDDTLEKDINLSIAMKLKCALQFFGYRVVTTRESDVSIHDDGAQTIRQKKNSDLKNRLAMLHESDVSMLVSVHQNMFSQSKYSGTQVFYGGNNPQSKAIAECVQKSVKSSIQPDNERVVKCSTKDIYILYRAEKPAIMVECGFMSNPEELAKLKSDEYQCRMAFSIVGGIIDYNSLE